MSQFASYELWLCDWTGEQIAYLSGNDLVSFSWQHKLNDAGVCRFQCVAETVTKDLFRKHYGMKLMRDYGSGFYEEYYGFAIDTEEWLTSNQVDEHYFAVLGMSPEWLLDQPLLQPVPDTGVGYIMYDKWWQYGPADDVVKLMVSESMGAGAYPTRQFANFIVQGDTGLGANASYEGRYVRLLDAIKSVVGENALTDFRVVRVPGGFEFRTYSPFYGTDRRRGYSTQPTIFSTALQNVLNPVRKVTTSQAATAIYIGWTGSGSQQDVYPLGDWNGYTDPVALAESPYSRRELYIDGSGIDSSDSIAAYAAQELIDQGTIETVLFDPIQTNSCLYPLHWGIGDLVTLDLWGKSYDMRITEIGGSIDGQNEEQIIGKAEIWRGAESV